MKTVALVASFLLHVGALSAVPSSHAQQPAAETKIARASTDACKCDLEITADCSKAPETR